MSSGSGESLSDPDLRAAEYVLGTLDAHERAELEREIAFDPGATSRLRDWEKRLAPLLDAVPAVPPPPWVRAALLRALPGPPLQRPDQLASLRRQVRCWQVAAAGGGLLATGLALFVAVQPRPEPEGGRYLAVVQGGGALPALIVRIDTRTGTAQVRPVGAEAPAGRNLELWYVGAEGAKPLGLVGTTSSRVKVPSGASSNGAIAVSVEPPGGSPTGQPTGPVIYTGKLIPE
ncbi:anti-sigma factor [Methylobacterium sp. GC_Met_2]|uniref:anti-sigma factor n=1 Tax=Methylobacterium sp. GC_Met_2 TaxID=2937376 RepID=UPI00226B0050